MSGSVNKKTGCRVTYIWLAGKDAHHDIRSKDRTMYLTNEELAKHPKELLAEGFFPLWNFDGSSTNQAHGSDTEVILKPVNAYLCRIPRPTTNVPWLLVLAECYLPSGEPTRDNSRAMARLIFEQKPDEHPWFGMEQEFFLKKDGRPYGWPSTGFPAPQGPYYCATGHQFAPGRKYVDLHYEVCLQMGLNISGTNAEVAPGQWEFQVGPCEGLEMGDQLTVARWVLLRILESDGLDVDYRAKPIQGDWNGSGLHTNFSTHATPNGSEGYYFYGAENNERLTGKHETSVPSVVTAGVGTRGTSIRIPNSVAAEGKGYMEDRRPAGDADPYLVSSRLFASCVSLDTPALDLVSPLHKKDWMKFPVQ
ncbi:Glutamine synthetase [Trypanosoma melophagium]|uniref:Glutamine synthetase n=1 Tax=Trypanosoma melophagium TaxID=715481 RepID=UPI00351A59D4|nr:Glutamine synthetase [Trypanosoma melophagium]